MLTSAVPHYVAAATTAPQPGVDVPLKHHLLQAFQTQLGEYLRSLALVKVESAAPLQVLCNVDRDPQRVLVTLVNHQREPVRATVRRTSGPVKAATPWMGQATLEQGQVVTTVPARDLVIVDTR